MSEWRDLTQEDLGEFLRHIPDTQREGMTELLAVLGPLRVVIRTVEEFDGQIGAAVGVEVEDGRRFAVRADGEVVAYPRADD